MGDGLYDHIWDCLTMKHHDHINQPLCFMVKHSQICGAEAATPPRGS